MMIRPIAAASAMDPTFRKDDVRYDVDVTSRREIDLQAQGKIR
jgi:hypothetical protein